KPCCVSFVAVTLRFTPRSSIAMTDPIKKARQWRAQIKRNPPKRVSELWIPVVFTPEIVLHHFACSSYKPSLRGCERPSFLFFPAQLDCLLRLNALFRFWRSPYN